MVIHLHKGSKLYLHVLECRWGVFLLKVILVKIWSSICWWVIMPLPFCLRHLKIKTCGCLGMHFVVKITCCCLDTIWALLSHFVWLAFWPFLPCASSIYIRHNWLGCTSYYGSITLITITISYLRQRWLVHCACFSLIPAFFIIIIINFFFQDLVCTLLSYILVLILLCSPLKRCNVGELIWKLLLMIRYNWKGLLLGLTRIALNLDLLCLRLLRVCGFPSAAFYHRSR